MIVIVPLVTLIVGLAFIEVALALFAPQKMLHHMGGYYRVPGTRYFEYLPNYREVIDDRAATVTFATNSYGIRDYEFDPARPHPRRVLFFGDSQAGGWGVELDQSFVKQFQKYLQEATGLDWQALNLAVGGGSTFDALYTYRKKGTPLTHQHVILGFYVGNDVFDNIEFQTRPITGELASSQSLELRMRVFFATHSHLWNLMRNASNSPLVYRLGLKRGHENFLDMLRIDEPVRISEGWRLTFDVLKELQALAAAHNAKLTLLLIPHKVQLNRTTLEAALAPYEVSVKDVEIGRPQRILKEFAAGANIAVVDLLEYFAPNERLYYFDNDVHLNADGHAAVGRILAEAFRNVYKPGR